MKEKGNGELGIWVAERCRQEGLSLRQAATKTGLSHATIADIIKGKRPLPETIKRLAQAFSEDGARHKLELEDTLLTLAGYRSSRPDEEKPSGHLAHVLDKLTGFTEPDLEMVGHFIDFILRLGKGVKPVSGTAGELLNKILDQDSLVDRTSEEPIYKFAECIKELRRKEDRQSLD